MQKGRKSKYSQGRDLFQSGSNRLLTVTDYVCVVFWRDSVLRVTYKKTKRVPAKGDDDDDGTRAILRVTVRQVLDHQRPPNVARSAADALQVNRRITLWTSGCSSPFCARRRPRLHRGDDYLVMGHVDRLTGHLLLDQRSVIEKWKRGWPAKIQVADSHCSAATLARIIMAALRRRCGHYIFLVHGQVAIIFVVSVGLSVCLFVCLCRVFLSRL